jgi:DNA-directed RNA polymerase
MKKRKEGARTNRTNETSRLSAVIDFGAPDVAKSVLGIGANLTHGSGDATLLQLAFHDADFDFCTTHDCVYTPANKTADLVYDRIREAFIEMCEYPTLQRFAELNDIPEMVPPLVNTYDPKSVMDSDYFFC